MRIGIVAAGTRIEPALAEQVIALAKDAFPARAPELVFHPQCFQACGHFAGDDAARTSAFLEIANDPGFDALWFARGGHGACRLAEAILPKLNAAAPAKQYLGYSDAGFLLAGLYRLGFPRVAHGPMPIDLVRAGGAAAVTRGLGYLMGERTGLEPGISPGAKHAAFNMIVLSHLIGTPLEPDLTDHVLMLEEVNEYMYRIDRMLFQITSRPALRRVRGLMLGRCAPIPRNEPDFAQTEEEVMRHWCGISGIAYLGRADIGHDIDNKIVPFGA